MNKVILLGMVFNVLSGTLAFVADWKTEASAKVFMYEMTSDAWRSLKMSEYISKQEVIE